MPARSASPARTRPASPTARAGASGSPASTRSPPSSRRSPSPRTCSSTRSRRPAAGSPGQRSGARRSRVLEDWGLEVDVDADAERPLGRAAPDRRDRARAAAGHPLHHPRRADRTARGARGDPAVRAHRPPAGGRRHLPLHLAPSGGDLRGLPQRHGAARRRGGRPRAARADAQGPRGRRDGRRRAARPRAPAAATAGPPARAARMLEVRDLAIPGGADDISFHVAAGEMRRARRPRRLRQGGGRRCDRRAS